MAEGMTPAELHRNLSGFSGTEFAHRVGIVPNFLVTDGVKYLVEHGHCYWLIDTISSYYFDPKFKRKLAADDRLNTMQIWLLEKKGNGAILKCQTDVGPKEKAHVTQKIEFTDFPFEDDVFKLYVAYTVVGTAAVYLCMLPSEY